MFILQNIIQNITQDPVAAVDSILYSPAFIMLQLASLLFSIFLVWAWIKLIKKTGVVRMKVDSLREAWQQAPFPKGKLQERWKNVQKRMAADNDAQWKLAIIEADAMLDEIIKSLGYSGDTMGERMRKVKPEHFPRLDDAWRAHKVRNFIAHDPNYPMTRESAQKTINIYGDIFKNMDIIE